MGAAGRAEVQRAAQQVGGEAARAVPRARQPGRRLVLLLALAVGAHRLLLALLAAAPLQRHHFLVGARTQHVFRTQKTVDFMMTLPVLEEYVNWISILNIF